MGRPSKWAGLVNGQCPSRTRPGRAGHGPFQIWTGHALGSRHGMARALARDRPVGMIRRIRAPDQLVFFNFLLIINYIIIKLV